jgi:putative ABC transport system permease protein
MDLILSLLRICIELGGLYGIAVLGLVISFRLIGFADLTVEGSFTTGAAISAIAIANGMPPALALILSFLAGSIAGLFTAFLHVKIGINKLLSGIITMTILYSINLRIMGRPNYSILDKKTIFDYLLTGKSKLILVLAISTAIYLVLWWLLRTEFGFFLRATGENSRVVIKTGVNPKVFIFSGLAISNGLIAFAGGLVTQNQGFADIGMGIGIIVVTLASLLIGEAVVPPRNIPFLFLSALIGSSLYQLIIAVGLRLGVGPWDLKLATGILLVFAVILRKRVWQKEASQNIGCDIL